MATQEDIFRQQVVTLLSRCNNDVPTLMKSIARSLNECGRSDVRADVDSTGTVVTVAQSPYHVSAHMTNFQNSLERLVADAKKELASIVPPITTSAARGTTSDTKSGGSVPAKPPSTHQTSGSVDVQRVVTGNVASPPTSSSDLAAHRRTLSPSSKPMPRSVSPNDHHRRCFAHSKNPRDNLPTSKYNGNYLLFRYGGKFPKHANYGFYRRYGCEGQGAATSEFHNLPTGQRPDHSHMYA